MFHGFGADFRDEVIQILADTLAKRAGAERIRAAEAEVMLKHVVEVMHGRG